MAWAASSWLRRGLMPRLREVCLVLLVGGAVVLPWTAKNAATTAGAQTAAKQPATGEAAADIARLKSVVPSQSHTMADVGYHWAGLWFAAEKKNWPLAQFFFEVGRIANRLQPLGVLGV